jgi:hypothetical protein
MIKRDIAENLAHGRVLDFLNAPHRFYFGIHHLRRVLKEGREIPAGQVAILVDCGGQNAPAVLTIPYGIVGTASEEGNAERGSANDHSYAYVALPGVSKERGSRHKHYVAITA